MVVACVIRSNALRSESIHQLIAQLRLWSVLAIVLLLLAPLTVLAQEDAPWINDRVLVSAHLRQEFENEDWYVPNTVDIKGFLTDIEKKNIALIKRYEKYADEYGDEYGR